MFEGSLVESQGLGVSGTQRWSTVGSMLVQCVAAGALLAIPLLHPEALPMLVDAPKLVVPLPKRPPMPQVRETAAASSSSAPSLPAMMAPTTIPPIISMGKPTGADDPAPMVGPIGTGMGNPNGPVGALVGTGGPGPNVTVAPARKTGPLTLSSGVTEGMLLEPIKPVYPRIAVAAGVQGPVVMQAMISKTGRIESLRVVSGSPMLRQAAMEAIQAAKYKPYLLNGEPTEVETTITVVFKLGS